MNTKLVLCIAVIVVAAAGGGAAYYVLKDKGDPNSDYTLLDSNNNIKEGLTLKQTVTEDNTSANLCYVVTSVSEDTVKYTINVSIDGFQFSKYAHFDMSSFEPSSTLDYVTPNLPTGVTVTSSGSTYTLNGTYTQTTSGTTTTNTFTNLKITYNGTAVTYVAGGLKTIVNDHADSYMETVFTFSTVEGELYCNGTMTIKDSCPIASFFSQCLTVWDSSVYAGATITSSTEKFKNVDATVYTLNGTANSGYTYENLKIYVYMGYEICGEGKVNNDSTSLSLSIFLK